MTASASPAARMASNCARAVSALLFATDTSGSGRRPFQREPGRPRSHSDRGEARRTEGTMSEGPGLSARRLRSDRDQRNANRLRSGRKSLRSWQITTKSRSSEGTVERIADPTTTTATTFGSLRTRWRNEASHSREYVVGHRWITRSAADRGEIIVQPLFSQGSVRLRL